MARCGLSVSSVLHKKVYGARKAHTVTTWTTPSDPLHSPQDLRWAKKIVEKSVQQTCPSTFHPYCFPMVRLRCVSIALKQKINKKIESLLINRNVSIASTMSVSDISLSTTQTLRGSSILWQKGGETVKLVRVSRNKLPLYFKNKSSY